MAIHTRVSLNVETQDVPLANQGIFTQLLATVWLDEFPTLYPFSLFNSIEPINLKPSQRHTISSMDSWSHNKLMSSQILIHEARL